jgi:CHASE3 domain sensor protein
MSIKGTTEKIRTTMEGLKQQMEHRLQNRIAEQRQHGTNEESSSLSSTGNQQNNREWTRIVPIPTITISEHQHKI